LWGLTFLTGEPRGIAEIELLTLTIGPSVLLIRSSYWIQTWRGRVSYVVALAAGLAWGCAIGLVQLLPGWSFIGFSQRSSISYSFFGAGSLVVRWTSLLFVPDISAATDRRDSPTTSPITTCRGDRLRRRTGTHCDLRVHLQVDASRMGWRGP